VVGAASGIRSIASRFDHTCALRTSGSILCWGHNNYAQSGVSSTVSEQRTPATVANVPAGVSSIATGGSHSCLALTNGSIRCWGSNLSGQRGDGVSDERAAPALDVINFP
jgi:alpha-tubulin suppressor-like RCC1 family protein